MEGGKEEMLKNKSPRLFVGSGMRGRGWHPENGALVWTDGSSLVLHPHHPSRDEDKESLEMLTMQGRERKKERQSRTPFHYNFHYETPVRVADRR